MILDLIYAACIALFVVLIAHLADEIAWRWRVRRIRRQVWKRLTRELRR